MVIGIKIFLTIFGVIFFICLQKLLNYCTEKDIKI